MAGVIHRREQVVAGGTGLDEQDVGARRHRMGPLHVEGRLYVPVVRARWAVRVGAGQVGASILGHDPEAGRGGDAELLVEMLEIIGDPRIPISIHDGDRLAAPIALDRVEAIGVPDLLGRQPHRRCGRQHQAFELLEGRVGSP